MPNIKHCYVICSSVQTNKANYTTIDNYKNVAYQIICNANLMTRYVCS